MIRLAVPWRSPAIAASIALLPFLARAAAMPPVGVTGFNRDVVVENTPSLLDPGIGNYDDWFELYNPADASAELAGYYLTYKLTDPFQCQVPTCTSISSSTGPARQSGSSLPTAGPLTL